MSPLEVRFFAGEVRVDGRAVTLPDKELELLFTIAAAGTINGEQLMDMLWPDADGDAAHNAFRVCLHRLRRRLGSGQVIHRSGKAYSLDDGIDVDLYKIREAMDACATPEAQNAVLDQLLGAIREGHASRAALGDWFLRFERLLWSYMERRRKVRASDMVTAQ
jgi:DNA-binding SARP family transcriptional activator